MLLYIEYVITNTILWYNPGDKLQSYEQIMVYLVVFFDALW